MHAAHDDALTWTREDVPTWTREDVPTWRSIDATITRLARDKGALDVELGRWLLIAQRERIERKVGFGSFTEYVERRLGYDARTTHERLRVARALASLPRLGALLAGGQRSWSAVRELTRVATPETEAAWIEASERMTVRQVEALVAGHAPGAQPFDARDPLLATYRVVVELSPDAHAEWQEAAERVRREIGPAASNRDVLRALVHKELGRRPDDRPAYQTAVTLCLGCERTWQRAGGELVEVPPAVGACARCDAEVVGVMRVDEGADVDADARILGDGGHEHRSAHVGGRDEHQGAHVGGRDEHQGARVGGRDEHRSAHVGGRDEHRSAHVGTRDGGVSAGAGDSPAGLDVLLRRLVERRGRRVFTRILSQVIGASPKTMTPKLRAAIRARDRGRCVVPGCTHFRFVDLHHHQRRADGGPNTLENVVTLCTQHHRLVHDGVLAIEGSPSVGWVVRHAGGTLYGAPPPS